MTRQNLIISGFLMILTGHFSSQAQEINPSTWTSFVGSVENKLVADTFRVQTFSDDPGDNWGYKTNGEASLFDPQAEGLMDGSGGLSLKMPAGSGLQMDDFPLGIYRDVEIIVLFAAQNLIKEENLYLSASRKEKPIGRIACLDLTGDYSISFKGLKPFSGSPDSHRLRVRDNPWNILLEIGEKPGSTKGGYYAIDSLYAFGQVKEYSLFTGAGNWYDAQKWSDDPPMRKRHAMINGEVTVDSAVACNRLYIGDGSVYVEEGQSLSTENLLFCDTEAAFSSAGAINIKEKTTVYRTLPEKDKWYFISFPFDVYAEGIDPAFTLKDDSPNEGGNFFYLYSYDGEARSRGEAAEGSYWKVVPADALISGQPIMQKNRGYLIALDEKADRQTICFSSLPGVIPPDFGKEGTISVRTALKGPSVYSEHHGWYLCGNPLPSPLPLQALAPYFEQGASIYLYENGDYMAYPMDSDYALPAFSAFFVKAERNMDLLVTVPYTTTIYRMLSTSEALSKTKADPTFSSPVSATSSPLTQTQLSYVSANKLFLENLLMPGVAYMVDLRGRICWQKEVKPGSTVLSLPSSLTMGFYIVCVKTSQYQAQHKFILND
ncbi:hypothetical protein LJC54_08585 [Parabacteroides sp. OttesenSCG-928-J18]|nr:hypothetical protein [Parabacteroides sp. OttesenSCG-928-J18]